MEDVLFEILDKMGFVNSHRTKDELMLTHNGPGVEMINDFILLVNEIIGDIPQ